LASRVGNGDKGCRKKVSSAALLGVPAQPEAAGKGVQVRHGADGTGWVPNSSNSISRWLKGAAPKVGLGAPPVGIS
jgi:hypothetical protein